MLAYLADEAGAREVEAILRSAEEGRSEVWRCVVNLGEVLYVTEREAGLETAQRVAGIVEQLPVGLVDADRALTFAAAHVNAHHSLSYADAFAVALAGERGAVVVTGDPEFKQVEPLVAVRWLGR